MRFVNFGIVGDDVVADGHLLSLVWLRRERACFCPVYLLEADTTDIPAIGGVALNQVGIDQQTGARAVALSRRQSLLGMPEQTGSVSLVPWTMMPAPLVGMAGRLLLWLNTIELCLMSPLEISRGARSLRPRRKGKRQFAKSITER